MKMSEEMKLIKSLCKKLGYEVRSVATEESLSRRARLLAMGCAFDPELEYEYELVKTPLTNTEG